MQTVFKNMHPQSVVYHQPESPEERLQALQALLACPTSSIHTERPPKDIKDAHNSFPIPVDADEIQVVSSTSTIATTVNRNLKLRVLLFWQFLIFLSSMFRFGHLNM